MHVESISIGAGAGTDSVVIWEDDLPRFQDGGVTFVIRVIAHETFALNEIVLVDECLAVIQEVRKRGPRQIITARQLEYDDPVKEVLSILEHVTHRFSMD